MKGTSRRETLRITRCPSSSSCADTAWLMSLLLRMVICVIVAKPTPAGYGRNLYQTHLSVDLMLRTGRYDQGQCGSGKPANRTGSDVCSFCLLYTSPSPRD